MTQSLETIDLAPEPAASGQFDIPWRDVACGSLVLRTFQFENGLRDPSRAIVCIPGFGATGRSFARLAPLADRFDIRMVSIPPGLRYHGTSSQIFADMVDEYITTLDRPVILGTSFGGLVALRVAASHSRPLSGLVLTAAFSSRVMIRSVFRRLRVFVPYVQSAAPFAAPVAARLVGGRKLDGAALRELTDEARSIGPEERTRRLLAVFNEDLSAEARRLEIPSLVIHGERDLLIPASSGRALAGEIPGSEYHEIAGAGHVPYLSHAPEFIAILGRFLGRLVLLAV